MEEIKLPELGEGIEKATIACWHVNEGDSVQKDDDLLEVVTDKATFNIPTNSSGTVKKIFFDQGNDANIGEVLAIIET